MKNRFFALSVAAILSCSHTLIASAESPHVDPKVDHRYFVVNAQTGSSLSLDELLQQTHAKSIYAGDFALNIEELIDEGDGILNLGLSLELNAGKQINSRAGGFRVGGGIALQDDAGKVIGLLLIVQGSMAAQYSISQQREMTKDNVGIGPQLVYLDKQNMARVGINVAQLNGISHYNHRTVNPDETEFDFYKGSAGPSFLAELSSLITKELVFLLRGNLATDYDGNLVEVGATAEVQLKLVNSLWLTLGTSYDRNALGDNEARVTLGLDFKYSDQK